MYTNICCLRWSYSRFIYCVDGYNILWHVNTLLSNQMVNRLPRLGNDVIMHEWRGCQVTYVDVVATRWAAMTSYCGSVRLGSSLPGNASVNTPFQHLEDCFLCGWCRGCIAPVTNITEQFLSEGSDIQVTSKPRVQKNKRGLPVRM
jgi:hypothetical protein